MKKISSDAIRHRKIVLRMILPVAPFVAVAYLLLGTDLSFAQYWLWLSLFCLFVAVIAFQVWSSVRGLVDEVHDDGSALVVRLGDEKARVELAGVLNVGYSVIPVPPRVTLRLATPNKFGDEVSFAPPLGFKNAWNPFAWKRRNEVAEDLILRVDRARRSG